MIRTVKDYEKLSEQYNKMLEERNSLIDDLPWYKAKVSRLERKNGELQEVIEDKNSDLIFAEDENKQLKESRDWDYEYQAMISNSISKNKDYFFTTTAKDMKNELEEVYRKAKFFDEVKEYALSKNKNFEDRKDTARSNKEFDYFNTLQIANKAIINKCKQLEDK